MTFRQFFAVIWARKWWALLVLLLSVGGTAAISLMLPKQYTGVASVVIDNRPDPIAPYAAGSTMLLGSFIATQVDVINSDRVALKVIRDLKLLENATLRRQWEEDGEGKGTIEQWLTRLLKLQLDVRPSRESNVINISYKARDPRFAAGMANAFAQAYIATTLELKATPARNFKTLFDEQTREARETLQQAQAKLAAFNQQKGIIATDERFDVESARLNELSSQLTQLQALAAESTSRQAQALGGQGDRLQEVLNNPVVGQLKSDLSRAEARLQELSSRLGDNHPQVIEAKANINELRARVEAETRRVSGGVGVTLTINRSREAAVRSELERQRAKVLQIKAIRDEGNLLQRDVESAQRIYDNLAQRQSQTTLESENTQSFANLLSSAQPPLEASSPNTLLNVLMALFLGLLLAIGVALLMELLDRRVRSADDVVAALGLPVLGTLPTPDAKRYRAGNRPLPAPAPVLQLGGPGAPRHGA